MDTGSTKVEFSHYTGKERNDRKREEKHLKLSSQVANPLKQKQCNSPPKRKTNNCLYTKNDKKK